MIKYEFMRAHGKGSEGSEQGGGVRKEKGGAKKRGVHAAQTPPVYATVGNQVGGSFIHSYDRPNNLPTFEVALVKMAKLLKLLIRDSYLFALVSLETVQYCCLFLSSVGRLMRPIREVSLPMISVVLT